MKILWFTWKDLKNPLAGGAEVVNEQIAKRLVADGHEVIFIVGGYDGCIESEIVNSYKVIRVGGRWTVYLHAYKYYKAHLEGWADLVIDEINTIPFFCKFYVKEKNIVFAHQLAREVWFYQMFFPLNVIGYLIEPLYLKLLKDRKAITISQSTKNDLIRVGFNSENIDIISEGIEMDPINDLNSVEKYSEPTILSLGSIRPMKRTREIFNAFVLAKKNIPNLKLLIAGDSNCKYAQELLGDINNCVYKNDINYLGKVSAEKRCELMQKSHIICVTSVKEGWGLIVTEANSQGTPAVVYNVDGLRDAVDNGGCGFITEKNNSESLGNKIIDIFSDAEKYDKMRNNSYEFSKNITFDRCYENFSNIINKR